MSEHENEPTSSQQPDLDDLERSEQPAALFPAIDPLLLLLDRGGLTIQQVLDIDMEQIETPASAGLQDLDPAEQEDAAGDQPGERVDKKSEEKIPCPDCTGKNPRKIARDQARCYRCHLVWLRANAPVPRLDYLPGISDKEAYKVIYAPLEGVQPAEEMPPDFELVIQQEYWMRRFLLAASQPVANPEDKHQKKFNGNALMENVEGGRYTPLEIHAHMLVLFQCVVIVQFGGVPPVPVGGDNTGYVTDATLTLEQRLTEIERLLLTDKLICQNVIEGRHILALAKNPLKFKKRKIDNDHINQKKKLEKRKRGDDEGGEDKKEGDKDKEDSVAGTPAPSDHPSLYDATPSPPAAPPGMSEKGASKQPVRDSKRQKIQHQPAVLPAPEAPAESAAPQEGPEQPTSAFAQPGNVLTGSAEYFEFDNPQWDNPPVLQDPVLDIANMNSEEFLDYLNSDGLGGEQPEPTAGE